MKPNKLIFPLVIALTAVLAATGCKKGNSGVTPLPRGPQPIIGDTGPGPLAPGGQISGDGTPNAFPGSDQPGGGSTSSSWDPPNMNQDRQTLAEYTVHFKFDSAAVLDSEQGNLAAVASQLNSNPGVKLLIEGNCDERGTEEYNRALGSRRALALRESLVRMGINPARIRTISYGKDKPVDPGHDSAAYAKNRRGDFVLCSPK